MNQTSRWLAGRKHPRRSELAQPYSRFRRELPPPMMRERTAVAFGSSIKLPGLATHEEQMLLWHPSAASIRDAPPGEGAQWFDDGPDDGM